MNNRIDQITKGLISLTVMLMFTVAFIAGQARANLPANELPVDDSAQRSEIDIMLDTLPHVVDLVLALPIDVEIRINDRSLENDNPDETRSDDSLVK